MLIEGASADDQVAIRDLLTGKIPAADTAGRNPDLELSDTWRDGGYPYRNRLRRSTYEKEKFQLQVELLKLQAWVREIVLFDRSWYNRAGVERVMGFCNDDEYHEFMRQVPEFERHLVRSGVHLIKFWFSVSRDEQRRRFKEREVHPLKQWKLSPVDLASLDKWDEYTRAKENMFIDTDTADAPWTVIKSDCKKRARLNAMRYVLHKLPCTSKDLDRIGKLDTLIVGRAHVVYEQGEHPVGAIL